MAATVVVGVVPVVAAGKAPVAASVLSANEAAALVRGPLDEVAKYEVKPTSENGQDHNTSCGYFPKGYRIDTADRPPDRGIQVALHTFPTSGEAKQFFDLTRDGEKQLAEANPTAKVTALPGVGTGAILTTKRITPEPKAVYQIAMASFWKGKTMAQITVWKLGSPASAIATTAAKQVASRLP
jgi:hypothetical protein